MTLIKVAKQLFVSFTAFEDFHHCPRLYYWKRIRRLEKVRFSLPFFLGRIIGPGINAIYKAPTKALTIFEQSHKKEATALRKALPLSAEDEEAIRMQIYIGKGMLEAYKKRYHVMIRDTKIISHEAPFHYRGIQGVTIVGLLDNIMHNRKSNYVHELKTTSQLTPSYVRGIKTRVQPAMYKYLVNRVKDMVADIGGKIKGAIFDVIQKPGIRQKKKETKQEFLRRVIDWYKDGSENKFHLERSHDLVLKEEQVMHTLISTTDLMKRWGKEKDAYYQNFMWCCPAKGFPCDMYELCHGEGGEKNPANMILYKVRPSHHVEDKYKEAED